MKSVFYWGVFLMVALSGCGTQQPQFSIGGFTNYYDTFVTETGASTNNLIITFGDLSNTTLIGQCTNGATPTVTIDPVFWSHAPDDDKQELINHELGHCILGRSHRNDLLPNGQPASIMNAYHFSPKIINANKDYYINELVTGN